MCFPSESELLMDFVLPPDLLQREKKEKSAEDEMISKKLKKFPIISIGRCIRLANLRSLAIDWATYPSCQPRTIEDCPCGPCPTLSVAQ